MRVQDSTQGARLTALLSLAVSAAFLAAVVLASPGNADPRLERAEERQQQRQEDLDGLLAKIDSLAATIEEHEAEIAALRAAAATDGEAAEHLTERVRLQLANAYKHGQIDTGWSLLLSDDPRSAAQGTRFLRAISERQQEDVERALASRREADARGDRLAGLLEDLESQRADLDTAKADAERLVAEAEQEVASVEATIERERADERRRREAERRRAIAAVSRSSTTSSAPSGSIACPIGTPRSYSDTWGAARSGGRAHRGTDMLSPRGTPIYAYESGTITRMHSNRLGGIVLYLRGDSGHSYYYAHLQGYVGGLSAGQRVSAGQHIAFNGDSGNATGIPHLHIEVMPSGRGNVNPYPYMRRACG